jgi:membrane complex biogenesis BtpA family protein
MATLKDSSNWNLDYSDIMDIFKNSLKIENTLKSIQSIFLNTRFSSKINYKPYFQRNYVWDGEKSIDLAKAVDAKFVREIFTGVYSSDFGLWNTNVGKTVRHQYEIGAEDVKLFFNIVPEAASYLGNRDIVSIAKSTVFNNHPDAICVSGLTAGIETNLGVLEQVKNVLSDVPVFANTGVRLSNVQEQLSVADGAIVGTTFKYEGKFENHVDEKRVAEFMEKVRSFRNA